MRVNECEGLESELLCIDCITMYCTCVPLYSCVVLEFSGGGKSSSSFSKVEGTVWSVCLTLCGPLITLHTV